jgi:hypothetical protein
VRGYRRAVVIIHGSRIALERATVEGDSPVGEIMNHSIGIFPSTAEHVKFRGNLPRPWGKAKYYLMTDSEQVPRGKGEKNPGRGVK